MVSETYAFAGPLSEAVATPIAGVYHFASRVISDSRGQFARIYQSDLPAQVQGARAIVQINCSVTNAVGAIRGLHFQRAPAAEAKWVRCLAGRIFDVAVDLRRGSPTFLRHFGIQLSGAAMNSLLIPEGCAHGFQVLEGPAELLYLHSAAYAPEHEGAVCWDDPVLAIDWPLAVTEISERDRGHPLIDSTFTGLDV